MREEINEQNKNTQKQKIAIYGLFASSIAFTALWVVRLVSTAPPAIVEYLGIGIREVGIGDTLLLDALGSGYHCTLLIVSSPEQFPYNPPSTMGNKMVNTAKLLYNLDVLPCRWGFA